MRPTRAAILCLVPVFLWLLVALASYFAIVLAASPHAPGYGLLGLAVEGAAAISAVVIVGHALLRRAWARAAVAFGLAVVAGLATLVVDWSSIFLRYELSSHHSDLVRLSSAYEHGKVSVGSRLPAALRLLASKDTLQVSNVSFGGHHVGSVLYIQIWQDWRAENGWGVAYFPETPDLQTEVDTAIGDQGRPDRNLGDGWWLVGYES